MCMCVHLMTSSVVVDSVRSSIVGTTTKSKNRDGQKEYVVKSLAYILKLSPICRGWWWVCKVKASFSLQATKGVFRIYNILSLERYEGGKEVDIDVVDATFIGEQGYQ